MRKLVLTAALGGTALALSACGDTSEVPVDTETAEPVESAAAAEEVATVIDANVSSTEELVAVEGVSPELADAIVAGQPYADVTELNAVLAENLTPEEASAVLVNVFVPVNLNDASQEAIALIPGMSDRMIGEFLEYRPYEDLGEFDREIGKYVDADEVARFRRYVTL